jgi:hypothetical protein
MVEREFREPATGDELRDFDMPTGMTKARAEVTTTIRRRFPYYGSPDVEQIQFANGFAELAAVALARAELYGQLLADEYDAHGLGALIGAEMSGVAVGGEEKRLELYEKSETVRGLVALESAERDRAATLIEKGVRLGMEAKNLDAMRTYGKTVSQVARAFAEELGVDWNSDLTRRAAQRALLTARERLGFDLRSADSAGPALTRDERERVRRAER